MFNQSIMVSVPLTMASYQMLSIGRNQNARKLFTLWTFSSSWIRIFSNQFLQLIWVVHTIQVRQACTKQRCTLMPELTLEIKPRENESLSRFASTAINWLGGPDHMVEAGADSEMR